MGKQKYPGKSRSRHGNAQSGTTKSRYDNEHSGTTGPMDDNEHLGTTTNNVHSKSQTRKQVWTMKQK